MSLSKPKKITPKDAPFPKPNKVKFIPKYTDGIKEGFVTTIENLKETLKKYGVAIIHNVIDAVTCEKTIDGLWDYLELVSGKWKIPIKRNDKSTWKHYRELKVLHGMLMKHFGIGQAQFAWDLRQKEEIYSIFMELYGVDKPEDLLSSFDGASFLPDPNVVGQPTRGWLKGKYAFWMHTDQSFLDSEFRCVQSWVTMHDVNEYDATLFVIPKSHLIHEEYRKKFDLTLECNANLSSPNNWQLLTEEQLAFAENHPLCKEYGIVGMNCPKGSMAFFDSREIHCGSEHFNHPDRFPNDRFVQYICFAPRSLASEEDLIVKRNAFKEGDTTAHWPGKNIRVNSRKPRQYSAEDILQEMVKLPLPSLTPLGLRFAGFDDRHKITDPLEIKKRARKSATSTTTTTNTKSPLFRLKDKLIKK